MIKTKELRGIKAYRAMQVFNHLMLGLKMLPAYCTEHYEDFFDRVSKMPAASQEALIREAAVFVELQRDEIEALACFAADPNGVPYSAENLGSLDPKQIHEIVVAVCMKIAEIKIDLVSEDQKKNSNALA